MHGTLTIRTPGKGLHDITANVERAVVASGINSGLCHLFIQHTSCSLLIQENADPAVRRDLEAWLSRLVREGDPIYTHDEEGPDDMPSHIRSALTAVSVSVPVVGGRLGLGRWQGIYLWEHRTAGRERTVIVTVVPA
jgi:secondary thiamine-phosphate synthase enzyme